MFEFLLQIKLNMQRGGSKTGKSLRGQVFSKNCFYKFMGYKKEVIFTTFNFVTGFLAKSANISPVNCTSCH